MNVAPVRRIPVEEAERLVLAAGTVSEFDHATLDALAQLPQLEYDRRREAEAKALGVRVGTLDTEVAKRRPAGADDDYDGLQGRPLELPEPESWPDPVDGAILLDDLVALMADYLRMPVGGPEAVALWVLHAHSVKAFYHTPRLDIASPTKGCGKTVLLDWLEAVTPRSIRAESVTPAVLFRVVDQHQPTLLVDEVDHYIKHNDELIAAVNAGHRRGGAHLRCEGDNNQVRSFRTFAPVALAGIGRLPATIIDRSISVRMQRATKEEAVRLKSFRGHLAEHERVLCRMAARWAADNLDALAASEPDAPEWMFNRTMDNWRPLLAVADAAGGHWPQTARAIARKLTSTRTTEEEAGVQVLIDIRAVFAEKKIDRLPSEDIVGALLQMEGRPWAEWGATQRPMTKNGLARLLSRFDIHPKNIKLAGERVLKGYAIEDFAAAFASYIVEGTPHQTATPLPASNSARFSDSQTATEASGVAVEKRPKAAETKESSVVADGNPLTAGVGCIEAPVTPLEEGDL